MDRRDEIMNLVMFYAPTGRMASSWRSPTSPVEELWGPDLPIRFAQRAEAAKFDAIFMADVLYFLMGGRFGAHPFPTGYEPFTTMSVMAAQTQHIGLIGTASTTFIHPYNMARYLTSLDWLSGGRAGWNLVTSQAGEEHYGLQLPPNDERYVRAEEYLAATKALWDAWDDDAVVNDRANAAWARSDRIHPVEFEGRFSRTAGQLFMHRSPQGWPVIVQAGQSPAGMDFAARNAEVVFTAQTDLDVAQDFYREIKERAAAAGRDPDSVRILPGITPIVAETTAGARAFEERLDQFIDLEMGRADLEIALQTDLSGQDPDSPIPPDLLVDPDEAETDAFGGSRYRNFYNMVVRHKLTMRRIIALNDRALGHSSATGSVHEVADQMQEWFEGRACDGFAITPVTVPEGLDCVCDVLVPELRRRGLTRSEYQGATLRENLGLPRPASPSRVAPTVSA
ncbi:NtaA/DmoA family FMN-dependent monooxygenase [Streptomyces sp. NPDC001393]